MPALLTTSTPKAVYPYNGKNLAPKSQLNSLSPRDNQKSKVCDSLKRKFSEYKTQDVQPLREILEIGRMVAACRLGKNVPIRNRFTGRMMFVKKDGQWENNKTVAGLFQFYCTKIISEWLSSRPERDPVCTSNDDQIEEFISAVKTMQDSYDRKFFTDEYEQKEILSAQDYGTWLTRFRYDPLLEDITCELLDFPACKWDLRFRAEESPYFLYESKCSVTELSDILDREVPEDGDDSDHYGLQLIEQIAKMGGNVQGEGQQRPYGYYENIPNEVVVTEMWLKPSAYADIFPDESELTLSGITLPKGKSLAETFPDGLCAVGINDMDIIFQLHAENIKDHIVSGIYHLQSFSGVGKGISDAVDVIKDLNDLHSQALAHVKAHGAPAWGTVQGMVSEQQARDIIRGNAVIPFDFSQAPDGMNSINDVVQALVPGQPSSAMFEYQSMFKDYLQMAMQTTSFSNGMPGVDNKTATGAIAGEENADKMLIPQHRNKADHRRRSDKVIYNLFKRFVDKPKFFSTRNSDHNGITNSISFSGDKFKNVDIDFEVVENSEIAKTPQQQQRALSNVFQFTGGLQGLEQSIMTNPELASEVVSAFGAKLSIPRKNDIARVCRKRIQQAKPLIKKELQNQQMLTQSIGIMFDNANLSASILSQIRPPIHSKEPYHQQKAEWLSELLDTDEFMYGTNGVDENVEALPEGFAEAMRDFIGAMVDRHIQEQTLGQMQIQQDQNTAGIIANLPMLLGEQAMNEQNQAMVAEQQQAQVAQQQQQAMMQNEQALAMKSQEAEIAEKSASAQRQHEDAQGKKRHNEALQLEALKALASQQKPVAKAS